MTRGDDRVERGPDPLVELALRTLLQLSPTDVAAVTPSRRRAQTGPELDLGDASTGSDRSGTG